MIDEEFIKYAEEENNRGRKKMIENGKRVHNAYIEFQKGL